VAAAPPLTHDPTLERLDDQINWYDRKGTSHKRYFNTLKVVAIVAAAAIPFLAALPLDAQLSRIIAAALGALIVIIEGIQQLYQLQTNWLLYRSTCESLKHEKYLFLAGAGPYGAAQNPHSLLAERIESLVSQEHAKWTSTEQGSQRASQPDSAVKAKESDAR
jgi:Protein of unknown function (DUF4231)